MIRVTQLTTLIIIFISGSAVSFSQSMWDILRNRGDEKYPYHLIQEMFREGISVTLEIDTMSRDWGINQERLFDQLKLAIENSGWAFNPSSPNIMQVKIDSTQNAKDNYRSFRIELTHSLDEFPIKRTIELQKGDNKLISSVVYQMVHQAGIKSRNQLLKEMSKKRNPETILQHRRAIQLPYTQISENPA